MSYDLLQTIIPPRLRPLTVTMDVAAADELLSHWRWLVPQDQVPIFATALGDIFTRDQDGRVHWLDVGSIEHTPVAASVEEFGDALHHEENVDFWFGPRLVGAIEEAGMRRRPDECYSYLTLPILGGEFDVGNFKVRTLAHHLHGWGPIAETISSLPDGSTVQFTLDD